MLMKVVTVVGIQTVISLLLVLVSILSSIHGQNVGESCNVDNSTGVCKYLQDCPKVYQESLTKSFDLIEKCKVDAFNVIVCYPTTNKEINQPITPTPQPETTTTIRNLVKPLPLNGSWGSVARAKCAEAAEAVYGFVLPLTSNLNKKAINISLCALNAKKKKIVNGEKAEAKEFPHMAAIGVDTFNDEIIWFCGESLISKKIVLTAAHCIYYGKWGSAKWVRLGDLNLAQTDDQALPQTIAIEERIKYPDYKKPSKYHDIAILRLEKEAEYNAFVRPACLSVDWSDVNENNKPVAIGWGANSCKVKKKCFNLLTKK